MAGSAWLAARSAIHTRLWTDGTLKTALGSHPSDASKARVFDGDPERLPEVPYVVLGEVTEEPDNRMGGKVGRSLIVTLHAWSKTTSDSQRDTVADRIDELLDNYLALSVTGYVVNRLDLVSLQYLTDSPTGGAWTPLRHAIARYQLDLVEA